MYEDNGRRAYIKSRRYYEDFLRERGRSRISFWKFVDEFLDPRLRQGCYLYYNRGMEERNFFESHKQSESSPEYPTTTSSYGGPLDGFEFSPASEVDRQTLERWTKGESLSERWAKLK